MGLVSICIPTYNGAKFLSECLESAIAQTYANVEILIVDDCSSDNSVQIAGGYAERDGRIKVYVNEENLGLVGNWNRCIENANGEWIKYLFQDDVLYPECVQQLMSEARIQNVRFIACDREFIFDDAICDEMRDRYKKNRSVINEFLGPARGASAANYAERVLRRFSNNYVGEPTATLLHRSLIEECGGFNEEFQQVCDVEFWARAASHDGLAYVPAPLAAFRVHGSAMSAINRGSNAFRSGALDALALIDSALEDDSYAKLRSLWKAAGLLGEAERDRKARANHVREYVRSRRGQDSESARIKREYEQFLTRHPHCRVPTASHIAWLMKDLPLRYKFRLGQLLNPILPKGMKRGSERKL